VRDSRVGGAHFSEEFQNRGESPTLDSAPDKHTKTSAEKSTRQYLRDTYKDAGANSRDYRGRKYIPKLDICQEERLRVAKISDLAILQENPTKIDKTILFPLK
jgi:hypothetical protein